MTPGAIPSHMDTPSKPPQRPYLAGPATGHTHASLSVAADTRGRPNFAHANQYTTPKAQPAVRPQQPANDSKPLPGRPSNQNNDLPPPLPCDQSKMNNEPAALVKRSHSPSKTTPSLGSETPQETPAVEPGIWYSARVATMTEPGKPAPTFDPKFESPSLRKTYTVDHNKSAPVSRKTFQNLPPPSSSQALHKPIIHNAPSSSQTTPLSARTAVDFNKRPGPGTFASPAKPTLTTSYRPPTRRSMTAAANDTTTAQNMNGKRPPLSEMTNIPPVPGNADALKKPKVGENPAHNVVLEHDRPR